MSTSPDQATTPCSHFILYTTRHGDTICPECQLEQRDEAIRVVERKRLAAMLRAEADVEMQGYRWGWYDMAMRLRKWADALESTGTI